MCSSLREKFRTPCAYQDTDFQEPPGELQLFQRLLFPALIPPFCLRNPLPQHCWQKCLYFSITILDRLQLSFVPSPQAEPCSSSCRRIGVATAQDTDKIGSLAESKQIARCYRLPEQSRNTQVILLGGTLNVK